MNSTSDSKQVFTLGCNKIVGFHGLIRLFLTSVYWLWLNIDFGWIDLGDAKFSHGKRKLTHMSSKTKRKTENEKWRQVLRNLQRYSCAGVIDTFEPF